MRVCWCSEGCQPGITAQRERLAAEERIRSAREAATLDSVAIGEQQPEVEHDFSGGNTQTGIFEGRRWRDGSWFRYTLNKHNVKAADLVIDYWGGDDGRTFDIFVNDALLVTEKLNQSRPGKFIEKSYSIPASVLAAASHGRLTIKFVAKVWVAGGIFDLRLMKIVANGAAKGEATFRAQSPSGEQATR